ncbi:hypothetical protein MIPYR_20273 [uncultured Microbacterium sp.]|uniref:Uncharacterized protein n=1 Tax=uncultured Microbacterium sp. TaxID=191216 RepID=A0A1Y5NZH5_9MICO|nr:hypothetical protein MIPYR_20273 [uncultured Microbacterium sp.]
MDAELSGPSNRRLPRHRDRGSGRRHFLCPGRGSSCGADRRVRAGAALPWPPFAGFLAGRKRGRTQRRACCRHARRRLPDVAGRPRARWIGHRPDRGPCPDLRAACDHPVPLALASGHRRAVAAGMDGHHPDRGQSGGADHRLRGQRRVRLHPPRRAHAAVHDAAAGRQDIYAQPVGATIRATHRVIFGSGAIGLATRDALRVDGITPRIMSRPGAASVPTDVPRKLGPPIGRSRRGSSLRRGGAAEVSGVRSRHA